MKTPEYDDAVWDIWPDGGYEVEPSNEEFDEGRQAPDQGSIPSHLTPAEVEAYYKSLPPHLQPPTSLGALDPKESNDASSNCT